MSNKTTVFLSILMTTVMAVPAFAEVNKDNSPIVLVNSDHRIEKSFDPEKTTVGDTYFYLQKDAADELIKMLNDMEKDLGQAPMIVSTYRSYERQERVFNNDINSWIKNGCDMQEAREMTSKYIQIPGGSEHHTALAADLSNDGSLEEDFIDTEAGVWIKENSYKYGFVVRYPKGKEKYTKINYEPWHIRYVGHPYADIIYKNNWCLEEFIAYMKKNTITWQDPYNIWYLYFVKEPIETNDENTTVNFTNSGGYIVTTKRSKDSFIDYSDDWNDVKRDLQKKLINKIADIQK